jgi:hypothetical protein
LPRSRVKQQLLQPRLESRSTLGLCNWEVRAYAKTCSCLKLRSRKASELMVKHRAASLMCRDFLETFIENLPPVHAALKELCILKHNTTLYYTEWIDMNYLEFSKWLICTLQYYSRRIPVNQNWNSANFTEI